MSFNYFVGVNMYYISCVVFWNDRWKFGQFPMFVTVEDLF